ncbi:MAG: type IX secretion system membrane protein PorP/SprF [Flavobacteriia bacterium]|jgi:type IX secretion system PorP/SprF family membrane protein
MKKLKSTCFLLFAFSTFQSIAQQDPLFTQFWNTPTSYNPANAGLNYKHQAGVNYRNNWGNTLMASYNTKIEKYKSGIGFNYIYETNSAYAQNRFDLNYSYHFDLGNEKKLAFGTSVGIAHIAYIPGYHNNSVSGRGSAFIANFGLVYKAKKLTLGLSSTHLNEARIEEAYFKFTRNYYFSASYDFNLSDNFTLKPQLLFRTDASFHEANINLLAIYKKQYWLGITGRIRDSYSFMAGVDFKEKYRIGYSYDITVSKLNNGVSNGSHEIVLGFLLK